MVWQESPSICEVAENYYYDVIDDAAATEIPPDIAEHMKHCPACRKRIEELKQILRSENECDAPSNPLAKALEWHYTKIGEPLGCHDVKPFLPAMAIPEIAIHIPTPITVHLDHCKSCADALNQIRSWQLTSSQYMRLSAFLSPKQNHHPSPCLTSCNDIAAAANLDLSELDPDTADHICLCPDCRDSLYNHRAAMIKKASQNPSSSHFPCKNVRPADFFDYIFPYRLQAETDDNAAIRPSLAAHLRECPDCLNAMQNLHQAIYAVKKQNSGIVTIFHVKPQENIAGQKNPREIYSDWPIRVEVRNVPTREKQTASLRNGQNKIPWYRSPISRTSLHRVFKPLLKPAAVAAMFLVAFSLVLHLSSPAQGLDPVYDAMKNVNQIYIARYAPQSSQDPIQEQWLSASAGIHLNKTGSEEILQNTADKIIQSRNIRTGETATVPMPDEIADHFQKSILLTISRLLPFNRLSQAPLDAQWTLLPPDPASPDSLIYELSWKDPGAVGEPVYRKWRCVTDSRNRMSRAEWYKKLDSQSDYSLEYYTLIEYPREQDILDRVKTVF